MMGIVHHNPGYLKISSTHFMIMPAYGDDAIVRLIDGRDQENEELCTLQHCTAFSAALSIP
jgi:hypothetical protein